MVSLVGKSWSVVEDCRNLFPPRTGLHGRQKDPGGQDNEVVPFEVTTVGSIVESFPALAEHGLDLILASAETVDALAQLHGPELFTAEAVAL